MANPSLQIGNSNWAIKEDDLLGYSTVGTNYLPKPMTMTRASAGTRVNAEGLVNYAEVIGSEEIDCGHFSCETPSTDWPLYGTQDTNNYVTFSNNQVILRNDGTGSGIRQVSLTSGKLYTITIDVADIIGNGFKVDIGGVKIITTTGVQTFNLTSNSNALILYRNSVSPEAVNGGTINSISVKEITRNNLARVDYTDGTSSLLVEPMRTNLIPYSEDFSNAIYIKDSTVSVGTTNNVSPSGESNATKIDVTASGRIYANLTTGTYTTSVFIKAGTFAYFRIIGVQVDLVAETNANGTIESFGNGWFKVGINYTGFRPFQIQAYPDGSYATHTTSGNYFIWGSQIEAGSYATSYIPTSGGTVTRVKDQYSKTGISNLINSTEGVLFVEMAALTDDLSYRTISLNKNNANDECVRVRFHPTTNSINGLVRDGASAAAQTTYQVSDIKDFHKVAFKYKSGESELWVDGFLRDTSADTFTLDSLNNLNFNQGTASDFFYGKVRQLQVYKTALTDEQLKTLTT